MAFRKRLLFKNYVRCTKVSLKLIINNGTVEDLVLMKNILDSYDVRTDVLSKGLRDNEMGEEFIAALVLIAPSVIETLQVIMPAITTYISVKKPSGTKNTFEVVNGERRLAVTREDGKTIDIEKLVKFCNETNFFE